MKKVILSSWALLAVGCSGPVVKKAPPAVLVQDPVVAPVSPGVSADERLTTPSVRKAYYVGQLIDPQHPELMYRPGIVYREEVPERWNRNASASAGAARGIIARIPDPAILAPSSPEQQQLIAEQQRALELLARSAEHPPAGQATKEGATVAPEPPPASVPPAAVAPVPPSAAGHIAPAATAPTAKLAHALVPNADGAIELSAEILDEVDRTEPNPFVKRMTSRAPVREIVVTVSGTAPGPRPTASVNGRLLNIGDAWEGFTVAAITRDAVFLQRERFLLQIPLARERGVTVRLPP